MNETSLLELTTSEDEDEVEDEDKANTTDTEEVDEGAEDEETDHDEEDTIEVATVDDLEMKVNSIEEEIHTSLEIAVAVAVDIIATLALVVDILTLDEEILLVEDIEENQTAVTNEQTQDTHLLAHKEVHTIDR